MKILFSFLSVLLFAKVMAQDSSLVVGDQKWQSIIKLDHLSIYVSPCEAGDSNPLASNFVIGYDSTKRIGYLHSYRFVGEFDCQNSSSPSTIAQIEALLSRSELAQYTIGMLYRMEDSDQQFIGYLALFKSKKFKRFTRKASRLKKRRFSGEIMRMREYDYSRYAQEFILAKMDGRLSLIEVQ